MNKKAVVGLGVVLIVAIGATLWWMSNNTAPAPVSVPPASTPASSNQTPAAPTHTSVEEYDTALASIHAQYDASISALGATDPLRGAHQAQWLTVVQDTNQKILRLTVPAAALVPQQNRIIAFYGLAQALKAPVLNLSAVAGFESTINSLWK